MEQFMERLLEWLGVYGPIALKALATLVVGWIVAGILTAIVLKTPDYWDVRFDVTEAVKQRFDAENINIPFPQRDVHLHQVA